MTEESWEVLTVEIARLRVEPGDLVVVSIPRRMDEMELDETMRILKEKAPHMEFLLLGPGVEIRVVTPPKESS